MNALRVVAGFLQRWLLPARPAGLYDRQLVVLALALNEILGLRQRRLISC